LEKPYDLKSDSWALGCIIYELACLKRPFDAKNLPSIVMKICHGDPKPVTSAYSIELRSLVACLLEKKSHERPSMDEITRMPFFAVHLQRAETVAAASKPAEYHPSPKSAPQALSSEGGGSKASSPVPNAKVSSRFEKMREKLASNPRSPSASQSGESGEAAPPAEAKAAEPEEELQLEATAPDLMEFEGMDLPQYADEEQTGGVGDSMLEVLEFTKSLLFKDEGEGANLAARVYGCSKELRDNEAEEEAAALEKLWEDALGKASNGEEIERVANEAEQLSETLRAKGLEKQADEVESIFSEASFDSGDKKGEGCVIA